MASGFQEDSDPNAVRPSDRGGPYVSQPGLEGRSRSFATVADLPIAPGEVLADRYTVCEQLGKGGFGAVYLVDDAELGEKRALKIVVVGDGKAEHAREQILHEFKLRERIGDTTHIVRSQDPRSCEYKGLSLVLLPMEPADGRSFRQWLADNSDIEKRCQAGLKLFKQACAGVKAIHDAALAHLDIKPENILLVDKKAKVTDFGVGRYVDNQFADNPDEVLRQGVGTPQYMSPEQFRTARQREIGAASDIYSLGLVLYELLDGALPFDGTREELREKHLNMSPPPLKGKVAQWWPVVERCLSKEPQKRYPSIERLLIDLDRATEGIALSVDVACPNCGHINVNRRRESCEKCSFDLADLFRICPRDGRRNRLDVEVCEGCGFEIAAHFLYQQRRDRVALLKDEDPVEAIELLELMLRSGAGDEESALIKDLRNKQTTISSKLKQAGEHVSAGALEEAIRLYREVLELVPRHRTGATQLETQEALLSELNRFRDEALELMDTAQFAEAETRLQDALQLCPNRQVLRQLLEESRKRASEYPSLCEEASTAAKHKQLHLALKKVEAALSFASKNEHILSLRRQLKSQLDKAQELVAQAERHLSWAEFDDVTKCIQTIEEVHPDQTELSAIKEKLRDTKAEYTQWMNKAREALESKDLDSALQRVSSAQSCCPNSSEAGQMIKGIQDNQAHVRTCLKKAGDLLSEAKFDQARAEIDEASKLWSALPDLGSTEDRIASIESEYMSAIQDAERESRYDKALEHCDRALQVCSKSEEACELRKSIEEERSRAEARRDAALRAAALPFKFLIALAISPIVVVVALPFAWLADDLCTRCFHDRYRGRHYDWPEDLWTWLIRDVWRWWALRF
ncbi:MAG: hypothetical protein AMXMBFR13_06160 [Phycisphaerae bacterium]